MLRFLGLLFGFWFFVGASVAKPLIVFVGDSLTDGYGLARPQAFPEKIRLLLEKNGYPTVKVINTGESGITSARAPAQIRWALQTKPDLLVLCLGANDGIRGISPQETKKNLTAALKLAQEAKVKLVLSGVKLPKNYGEKHRTEFENIFTALGKTFPTFIFQPFLLEGVAGIPELNLSDGIHPNESGHDKIAQGLLPYIRKALND